MKDKMIWQHNTVKLMWNGGIYLSICVVLFLFWVLFFLTPNVSPLWQQVVGCILLPFGLLIKLPANTLGGIAICMVLNTLFWAIFPLIIQERFFQTQRKI
ncbi:hypothetical protein [Spirosoma foliorum]|uniref:Uncharacterized protein n=1 Tax=Spirosoma foliorum TaxID=2710596 RepID=A0A7G5GZ91_9BACT|nr:hypothetical protein [Spirosoma foliorum]QMW04183.1 hypothetical protein H3H32_04305 [Spirosoma foliorum]